MAILQIIKYEGDNSTFIWKHPCEDFNSQTQLIVHESQEAIFFMNGQALDLFGAGRHTLLTQNIPLIRKILNKPTGDETTFHCEVYFINKVEQLAIKWGTDSKVQYLEPVYKIPITIGASGEMGLRVEDSRKLLLKLLGTENFLSQAKLIGFFRAFLMTKVKTYIAQSMKTSAINIFEIDEKLVEFSEDLKNNLIPDFLDYGISLEQFFVTTIVKPDGEAQYEKFKELHFRQYADVAEAQLRQKVGVIDQQTETQKMVIEAEGLAKKRAAEGYTYQQERGFDVAGKVAENEGVGEFTNMGIGLGMMAGVGGTVGAAVGATVGGAMGNVMQPVAQSGIGTDATTQTPQQPSQVANIFCEGCGAPLSSDASFCDECGAPASKPQTECSNCAYVFERPGKFCPKCGTKREG